MEACLLSSASFVAFCRRWTFDHHSPPVFISQAIFSPPCSSFVIRVKFSLWKIMASYCYSFPVWLPPPPIPFPRTLSLSLPFPQTSVCSHYSGDVLFKGHFNYPVWTALLSSVVLSGGEALFSLLPVSHRYKSRFVCFSLDRILDEHTQLLILSHAFVWSSACNYQGGGDIFLSQPWLIVCLN